MRLEKLIKSCTYRATLEITLKHALADKKTEYDIYVKVQKEKERDSKSLKKIELQLKAAQDSLANIKIQHEKISLQVSCLRNICVCVINGLQSN